MTVSINDDQALVGSISALLKGHFAGRSARIEIDDAGIEDFAAIAGIHMHVVDVQGTALLHIQDRPGGDVEDAGGNTISFDIRRQVLKGFFGRKLCDTGSLTRLFLGQAIDQVKLSALLNRQRGVVVQAEFRSADNPVAFCIIYLRRDCDGAVVYAGSDISASIDNAGSHLSRASHSHCTVFNTQLTSLFSPVGIKSPCIEGKV